MSDQMSENENRGGTTVRQPVAMAYLNLTKPRITLMVVLSALAGFALPSAADDAAEYPVGTADSMWKDPYMIGSYRHWNEIYPVRTISRGDEVSDLDYGTPIEDVTYTRGGEQRNRLGLHSLKT